MRAHSFSPLKPRHPLPHSSLPSTPPSLSSSLPSLSSIAPALPAISQHSRGPWTEGHCASGIESTQSEPSPSPCPYITVTFTCRVRRQGGGKGGGQGEVTSLTDPHHHLIPPHPAPPLTCNPPHPLLLLPSLHVSTTVGHQPPSTGLLVQVPSFFLSLSLPSQRSLSLANWLA